MVYRIPLPVEKLKIIPELKDLVTTPRNNHWITPYGRVLSYLLKGGNENLINFAFTCDTNGKLPHGINQAVGTGEDVRKAFQRWDARLHTMLSHVDKVLQWRLYTHHEIPSWTHPSQKLCLIGDAAHAMALNLAQGAAMGIEDAAVLRGILAESDFYDLSELLKTRAVRKAPNQTRCQDSRSKRE
ncbi:putative FAD-binding domain-containing protein [Seiridium unicorne]|uniref:FAD-binding domain-containing protein n=1 Tax=Seiridium unicorne TaxID=138068 RepID=A0ABR2UNH4_9PEZI